MKPHVDYSLYVVTDSQLSQGRSIETVVTQALLGGASIIQYREKSASFRKMFNEVAAIKPIIAAFNKWLIVNDRIDLALAVKADGVHLGQSDMPVALARHILGDSYVIGVSVQSVAEAKQAFVDGADYLGVSGVFPTTTKTDVNAVLGLEMLRAIAQSVALPVVGIGGINRSNAAEVIRAGAQGVAVVSAVVAANNIREASSELTRCIREAHSK